jgi:hypothetical protein
MVDVVPNLLTQIVNAGPLAVGASIFAVFALSKLSRLTDIYLDRMAEKKCSC